MHTLVYQRIRGMRGGRRGPRYPIRGTAHIFTPQPNPRPLSPYRRIFDRAWGGCIVLTARLRILRTLQYRHPASRTDMDHSDDDDDGRSESSLSNAHARNGVFGVWLSFLQCTVIRKRKYQHRSSHWRGAQYSRIWRRTYPEILVHSTTDMAH